MNVELQFLENGRCCNDAQVPSSWQKKKSLEHYGIFNVHSKLFCLLSIKVYNLSSSIRCLLEKIAENIYQVLQSHFKNKILMLTE